MKQSTKSVLFLIVRYLILVAVAIPNLWIFYFIFTPLTIYLSYFFLNIFFDSTLTGNIITISGQQFPIEIVSACVAGSAYYLLTILNLSIPKIKIKQRFKMLGFAFGFLLLINLLRIFILSLMLINNSEIFDVIHKILWYFVSTLFVVGIWFAEVKLFKIKDIPFYSDLKFLKK